MRLLRPTTAFALLALLALSSCRTRGDVERDYAQTLRPAGVESAPFAAPQIHALKLRIYVDDDYQSHVLRWREKVLDQIDRANQILSVSYGVRFVPELRSWHRESNDARLEIALDELIKTDPGDDCDWVLGLTGVLPVATEDLHHIGMARMFSKHMVEHAMDDALEAAAIRKTFTTFSEDERLALYSERKKHKELVVLLHEWAHTLGALHTRASSDLMYASYDNHQERFGPPNAEILLANLGARLGGQKANARAAEDEVRAVIARDGCPSCDPVDLATFNSPPAQAKVEQPAAPQPAAPTPVASSRDPLTDAYNDAVARFNAHDFAGAWKVVAPLAEAHPDKRDVQRLACASATAQKDGPDARGPCNRWHELAPDDAHADLGCAWEELAHGDRAKTAELVTQLEDRLALAPKQDGAVWLDLAHLAEQMTLLTALDEAVPHLEAADEATRLRTWSRRNRRRLGLPDDARKFGITPAQEGDYAKALESADAHLTKQDVVGADKILNAALARWAHAPGLLATRCQLRDLRGQRSDARADCEAALREDDEAIWAHFDLALILMESRDLAGAASHLQRVIALDPTIKSAWRNLIEIRKSQRDAAAVDKLRRDYQQRFNASP